MLKPIEEYNTSEQMKNFIREAEAMINKYGWQSKTVMPYSWPEKVTTIIEQLKSYDDCTAGSREYLILLANGLPRIMNKWEEQEIEPKITIKMETGKIREVPASLATALVEDGFAVYA